MDDTRAWRLGLPGMIRRELSSGFVIHSTARVPAHSAFAEAKLPGKKGPPTIGFGRQVRSIADKAGHDDVMAGEFAEMICKCHWSAHPIRSASLLPINLSQSTNSINLQFLPQGSHADGSERGSGGSLEFERFWGLFACRQA